MPFTGAPVCDGQEASVTGLQTTPISSCCSLLPVQLVPGSRDDDDPIPPITSPSHPHSPHPGRWYAAAPTWRPARARTPSPATYSSNS